MNCVLFCLLVFSVTLSLQEQNDSSLISVVMIYRHGDRIPTHFAPTDPYKDSSYWPAEYGELTNRGIRQHYELGQWIRNRYGGFLPSTYSKKDIKISSSSNDRCIMSAASNLAGLYPPSGEQIWNGNLTWRPIPIHSIPEDEDFIFEPSSSCPKYDKLFDDMLEFEEIKEIDVANAELYAYLSLKLGVQIKNIVDVEKMYDTMTIEEIYGYPMPEWARGIYPDKMKPLADFSFRIPTYDKEMSKFATGAFFEKLSKQLKKAKNGESIEKLLMFSGHKTNVCDISNTLGVFRLASYASVLIFELKIDETKTFVNVVYKDGDKVEILKLKNCEIDCDLETFLKIIKPFRMTTSELTKECQVNI